jgi:hypothetical protein
MNHLDETLDQDHTADPYDVLLRAGICRRCGRPCQWPELEDESSGDQLEVS